MWVWVLVTLHVQSKTSIIFLLSIYIPPGLLTCFGLLFNVFKYEILKRVFCLEVIAVICEQFNSSYSTIGLHWWISSKESACNARDAGFTPGSERSPGEGYGNPLQNSCLENPMDKGAWWATVWGVAKESDIEWQNNSNSTLIK